MRLVLVGPLVYFKILRPSNPCTHGNGTLAYWGRGAYPLVGWFAEINGSLTDPCHTLTVLFDAKIASAIGGQDQFHTGEPQNERFIDVI